MPAGWPVLDVLPGIQARIVRGMPSLDPALDAVVERHWQAACARHSLFNGRVFCADWYDAAGLEGHWTEYRRVVAQMADPALRTVLGVQSLAVCGVLCCPDGIVVGRREAGSLYQPGLWQLPPAGSVDQGAASNGGADLRAALLAELWEELGLGADAVLAILPLCLVQHPTGVLDLGMQVTTPLPGATILAAHEAGGNDEYGELAVVPAPELEAWVAARGGAAAPTLHALLQRVR